MNILQTQILALFVKLLPSRGHQDFLSKRLDAGPETRAVSHELNSLPFQKGRKLPTIPKAVSKTILYTGNPNVSHHTVFLAHSHAYLLAHHRGWPLSYKWEAQVQFKILIILCLSSENAYLFLRQGSRPQQAMKHINCVCRHSTPYSLFI